MQGVGDAVCHFLRSICEEAESLPKVEIVKT